jgi:hypothetical protein
MPPVLHYPLSASASKRWINCPGSRIRAAQFENKSTIYAQEGTAAHKLGEMCFESNTDAADHLGEIITVEGNPFEVTEEMAEAVQVRLDFIRDTLKEFPGAEHQVECQFTLPEIHEDLGGTADDVVVIPFQKLIVADYKHGRGVAVDADENTQAMIYALGAAWRQDLEEVEIVIIQPRAGRKDGGIRRWSTTLTALMDWARKTLAPAAQATEDPNAPCVAGDWCRFCPAAAMCPETRKTVMAAAQIAFDDAYLPIQAAPMLPNLTTLDPAQVSRLLTLAEIVEPWFKNVREFAREGLQSGKFVPGEDGFMFKMVQGKPGNRKYADEQKAEGVLMGHLKQKALDVRLKSPAQAEKALKELAASGQSRNLKNAKDARAVLDLLTVRPEGKLAMVPVADPRPAVALAATEVFDADFSVTSVEGSPEVVSPDQF